MKKLYLNRQEEHIERYKVAEGIKRLSAAVLEDAVRCIRELGPQYQEWQDAIDWFLDPDSGGFTLNSICDLLNLDLRPLQAEARRIRDAQALSRVREGRLRSLHGAGRRLRRPGVHM